MHDFKPDWYLKAQSEIESERQAPYPKPSLDDALGYALEWIAFAVWFFFAIEVAISVWENLP